MMLDLRKYTNTCCMDKYTIEVFEGIFQMSDIDFIYLFEIDK